MTGRKKAITYSREFQDNAVRLAKLPSKTVTSVAAESLISALAFKTASAIASGDVS
jgi:hypothetical protein